MIPQTMLQQIKRQLIRKEEELQTELGRTRVRIKDGSDRMADFYDQASAEHDRTIELTIRGRDSMQIRQIQEAILRIEQGRFGICSSCGKAIVTRRLLLAPLSRYCTACKELLETDLSFGYHPLKAGGDSHAS